MIKQDRLCIKKINKTRYSLNVDNVSVGTLTYINQTISFSFIAEKNKIYQDSFAKLFCYSELKKGNNEVIFYLNKKITLDELCFIKRYKNLFFDIDDTILDFQKSEKRALTLALKTQNIIANDNMLQCYHKINIKYWQMVEKKIITRDECLIKRFEEFLPIYKINISASEFEDIYRKYLNKQCYVKKNARFVLQALKKDYKIYAITNGVKATQEKRMKKAKMNEFFLYCFISESLGYNKPSIEFFNKMKDVLNDLDVKASLIIGDSLTSDIKLGKNCNIDTCWLNDSWKDNNSEIIPTYEINSLLELLYR